MTPQIPADEADQTPVVSTGNGIDQLAPHVRIVYRDAAAKIHPEWPLSRAREALGEPEGTLWIDIEDRAGDTSELESLFQATFGFHPLAIEDALSQSNLPKLDDWGTYLYTVFHAIDLVPDSLEIRVRELDIFLGPNYIVTYHTETIDFLEDLRRHVQNDGGNRIGAGADHLLYELLDLGVSRYMRAIERLDELIDSVQDEVLASPSPETMRSILGVKQAAMRLHRVLLPQREVLNRLARDSYTLIDARDRVYFRDVYDSLVRLHDISETLRDVIAGALDMYLSAVANRTNEVMKTLTIVTVLVLPLNFVVGFFGMNFFGENIHLDTLKLPHMLLFVTICLGMLAAPWGIWFYARWRRWF